jgi:cytochrome c-type biogenesis protein CcmH/NrfF
VPQGASAGFACEVSELEMVSVQVICDGVREGKSDKQIYDKLTTEYGELIHYSPAFDAQTAVLW